MSWRRGIPYKDYVQYDAEGNPDYSLIPRNKHSREFLDKHPAGRKWAEDEKWWAITALLEANGNVNDAYEILERYKRENPKANIYLPPTKSEGRAALAAIKAHNRDLILKNFISDEAIWAIRRIAQTCEDPRVALSAWGALLDRALGKPTTRIQQEIAVVSWDEIEARRREESQHYAHGEWVNPEDETPDDK